MPVNTTIRDLNFKSLIFTIRGLCRGDGMPGPAAGPAILLSNGVFLGEKVYNHYMTLMDVFGIVFGSLAAVSLWYKWNIMIAGCIHTYIMGIIVPTSEWVDLIDNRHDHTRLTSGFNGESLNYDEYSRVLQYYAKQSTLKSHLRDMMIALHIAFAPRYPWAFSFLFFGLFNVRGLVTGFIFTSMGYYAFYLVYSTPGGREDVTLRTHLLYALRYKNQALNNNFENQTKIDNL